MKTDNTAGKTEHTHVRLKDEITMELRTEMVLLLALSACPSLAVDGNPSDVTIYQPRP